MKRILLFIIIFAVVSSLFPCFALSAASSILIDADDLTVLMSNNSDVRRPMASTTKIMTALLLCENENPDKTVTVKKEDVTVEGTSAGLRVGDKISYECLLYALLLESGNDAANVISRCVFGGKDEFIDKMNARANALGMNDTHFTDASGLGSDEHYSTAYDMALLTAAALKNDDFARAFGTETYRSRYNGGDTVRNYTNHNKLLWRYDKCTGGKTGFTKKAGRCLVSSAESDGVNLICVTLCDGDDWADHKYMYDTGFAMYSQKTLTCPRKINSVRVLGGEKNECGVAVMPIHVSTLSNSSKYDYKIILPYYVTAPVKCSDILGKIEYNIDGKTVYANIISTEGVKSAKSGQIDHFARFCYNFSFITFASI